MTRPRKLKAPRSSRVKSLVMVFALFCLSAGALNYVISINNHTDEYLVAERDLPAGSTFAISDTKVADAYLGASASSYLKVGDLPSGTYLLGPIRAGQLIPRSILASAVIDERVPVVVESAMGLSVDMVAGASVDLWVAPIDENKVFGEPYVLVLGAEVSELIENKEMFASQSPAVELWVPVEAVGPVLSSIAKGDSISLILRPTLAEELPTNNG